MGRYKYPFIPDKRMYAAVMGACSYIRKTGYFNRAVSYYADKYDVDADELEKHIRARQAAGQRGKKSPNAGKKYKWFLVCRTSWSDASGSTWYSEPAIVKGLSCRTVEKRFSDGDFYETMRNDYGGPYAPVVGHVAVAEFPAEADAAGALPNWRDYVKRHDPHAELPGE